MENLCIFWITRDYRFLKVTATATKEEMTANQEKILSSKLEVGIKNGT